MLLDPRERAHVHQDPVQPRLERGAALEAADALDHGEPRPAHDLVGDGGGRHVVARRGGGGWRRSGRGARRTRPRRPRAARRRARARPCSRWGLRPAPAHSAGTPHVTPILADGLGAGACSHLVRQPAVVIAVAFVAPLRSAFPAAAPPGRRARDRARDRHRPRGARLGRGRRAGGGPGADRARVPALPGRARDRPRRAPRPAAARRRRSVSASRSCSRSSPASRSTPPGSSDEPLLVAVILAVDVARARDPGAQGRAARRHAQFGQLVIAAASIADFAAVLLLSLLFSRDATRPRDAGSCCSAASSLVRASSSSSACRGTGVRCGSRRRSSGSRTRPRRSGCAARCCCSCCSSSRRGASSGWRRSSARSSPARCSALVDRDATRTHPQFR